MGLMSKDLWPVLVDVSPWLKTPCMVSMPFISDPTEQKSDPSTTSSTSDVAMCHTKEPSDRAILALCHMLADVVDRLAEHDEVSCLIQVPMDENCTVGDDTGEGQNLDGLRQCLCLLRFLEYPLFMASSRYPSSVPMGTVGSTTASSDPLMSQAIFQSCSLIVSVRGAAEIEDSNAERPEFYCAAALTKCAAHPIGHLNVLRKREKKGARGRRAGFHM